MKRNDFKHTHQLRALRIARRMIQGLNIADIAEVVFDQAACDWGELYNAVDPEYGATGQKIAELEKKLEAMIPSEGKQLLTELSDLYCDHAYAPSQGCFYLGFETAIKLLGPRQKMEAVGGGNKASWR